MMDIPSLGDIWQETLGLDDFDAGRLEAAIARNQRPAYGLTLVAHPLQGPRSESPRVLGAIAALRPAWEQALRCSFFPEEILHFTIYSLWRSRPEPFAPAELEELWNRLVSELRGILQATPSFTVSADGAILVGVEDSPVLHRLRREVEAIRGISPPRSYPPHVTIGQVLAPCGSTESFRQAIGSLRAWQDVPVGELNVPALKLVYYSNRLLAAVERWEKFNFRNDSALVHKSYCQCSQNEVKL
jgi:2'-5' RNA ligase